MSIRTKLQFAAVLVLTAAAALAQRGRQQQPLNIPETNNVRPREPIAERLSGTLLRLSLVEMVLQAADRRVIQIEMPATVKYTINNESGRPTPATAAAFEVGDQVTVASTRDATDRYHADRLQLDMKGGAEDKAAAEATLDIAFGMNLTTANFQSADSVDPVINAARLATVELTKSLPNFIVHQVTTRYINGSADLKTRGHKLDVVSGELVTENGEERFQNILVNGKKSKDDPGKRGSWSSGEYSSIIIEVLAPRTKTSFEAKGTQTVARRQALKYTFSVDEVHSRWLLGASGQRYLPAFSGTIWFDEETSRVLRVEIASLSTPRGFPIEKVTSSVEYDFFPLGDTRFLLPARADVVNCTRGHGGCARNEIEFTGYKKYGAESSISFDKEPPR